MRHLICLLSFCWLLSCTSREVTETTTAETSTEDSLRLVRNPVIPGFNPDPSVCRVGEDYYLVTSTFEYYPGLPVYHSRDLVNWEMIGHAIHRPEQLDLNTVPATQGLYAPTIRYHDGTYYVINTLVNTAETVKPKSRNFIVTATDPAGPWSDPHWIDDAPGIDPSLFFDDDGKVYYCGNRTAEPEEFRAQRDIWIQEIDLAAYQLTGQITTLESKPYYEDESLLGSPLAFEAPHIYKKDGTYFLVIANGGTGMGHAVSVWRSDGPLGPWELNPANPILSNRGNERSGVCCTGHADLIQTPAGDWWSVYLAVRSKVKKNNVMGRETFLAPVDWSGEWPVINPADTGRTALTIAPPAGFTGQQASANFRDDFRGEKLGLEWTTLRTPVSPWWKTDPKVGQLKINLRPDVIQEFAQPSFLGIRVAGMRATFTTRMTFKAVQPGNVAGLALLRGHQPSWTLVREYADGRERIAAYYLDSLLATQQLPGSSTTSDLRITLDDFTVGFETKKNGKWQAFHTTDGTEMSFPPAGRFTGAFAGLYASSRGKPAPPKSAVFDFYEMIVDPNE